MSAQHWHASRADLSFGYYADVGATSQPILGRQSGVGGRRWPDTGPAIKPYMGSFIFV